MSETDRPTSDATASTPPSGIELAPGLYAPESELVFQFARSSGPGGQNVNKVNSKAELWVSLATLARAGMNGAALARLRKLAGGRITAAGEMHIASDTHRTQAANRQATLDRLREALVAALTPPKVRRKTRPSAGARRRRMVSKKHRAEIKSNRRGNFDA